MFFSTVIFPQNRYSSISKRLWLIILSIVLLPSLIVAFIITPYFIATTKLFLIFRICQEYSSIKVLCL